MTKQNITRKGQATLEEMVQSGSQLILMHDDGTEQPIEDIGKKDDILHLGNNVHVILSIKANGHYNRYYNKQHCFFHLIPPLKHNE